MKYEPFAVERLRDTIKLGMAMQQEGDYNKVPFDIERAAQSTVSFIINNKNGFGVLAYTDEGEPIGMIAGSITPYFFGKGTVASDFVWYVLPEHRGSRTAVKMLKMFVDWAREQGALELYMGVSTNVAPERTGDVLKRYGFEHVGGNYKVRLNG